MSKYYVCIKTSQWNVRVFQIKCGIRRKILRGGYHNRDVTCLVYGKQKIPLLRGSWLNLLGGGYNSL